MGKKGKNGILDDYRKLRTEMMFEKVSEIIRNHPEGYVAKLKELGFEYCEEDDDEEIEERNATAEESDAAGSGSIFRRRNGIIRHYC